VNGQPRSVLTVAHFQGRWQAVEIGGAGLAPELATLPQQLTKASGPIKLVRFYQLYSLFALADQGGVETFMPIGGLPGVAQNANSNQLTPSTLSTPEQVLPQLQATFAEMQKAEAEAQRYNGE
jgi:hypothetical protein